MFEYTINDTKYVATKQEIEDIFIPYINVTIKNDTRPQGSYYSVGFSKIHVASFLTYDEDTIKISSSFKLDDPALPSSFTCEDTIIPKEEFVQWYLGSKNNEDCYFAYDKENAYQKTYNRLKNNIRKSLRKNNFFILQIEDEPEVSTPVTCPGIIQFNNVTVGYVLSAVFNVEYGCFSIAINPRNLYFANSTLDKILKRTNLPLTTVTLQIPDQVNDKAYTFKVDTVHHTYTDNDTLSCSFLKYTDKIFKSDVTNSQDIKEEFESIGKKKETPSAINIDDLF